MGKEMTSCTYDRGIHDEALRKSQQGNLESPPRAAEDPYEENRRYAEVNEKQGLTGSDFMSSDFNTPVGECNEDCEELLRQGLDY